MAACFHFLEKFIVPPKIVVEFQMNLNGGFKIIILNFLKTTKVQWVGPRNKAFIARLGGVFFGRWLQVESRRFSMPFLGETTSAVNCLKIFNRNNCRYFNLICMFLDTFCAPKMQLYNTYGTVDLRSSGRIFSDWRLQIWSYYWSKIYGFYHTGNMPSVKNVQ